MSENNKEKELKKVKHRKMSHIVYAISIMAAGLGMLISGIINWVKDSKSVLPSIATIDIVLLCLGSSFLLIGTIWLITQLRKWKEEKIKSE